MHLVAWVVLIGIPWMEQPRGHIPSIMNNGRNIYVAILQASLADPFGAEAVVWPRYGETDPSRGTFSNSTDYFKWMVTSKVLNVDFSFFGAPGLETLDDPNDIDEFSAEHNAWCIVADAGEGHPDTGPVIFTRNIMATNLNQFAEEAARLSKTEPFGRKGAVVILAGGSTFTVRRRELGWKDEVTSRVLTNRVLRP